MPLEKTMILKRLKEYIDAKGISISAFEKSVGMSNASFGKSLKNNGAIGTDKLENILSVYPDINSDWLLTGCGCMFRSEHPLQSESHLSTDLTQVVRLFLSELTKKDEEIKELNQQICGLSGQIAKLEEQSKGLDYAKIVSAKKSSSLQTDDVISVAAQL